jgi:hypothetical protein
MRGSSAGFVAGGRAVSRVTSPAAHARVRGKRRPTLAALREHVALHASLRLPILRSLMTTDSLVLRRMRPSEPAAHDPPQAPRAPHALCRSLRAHTSAHDVRFSSVAFPGRLCRLLSRWAHRRRSGQQWRCEMLRAEKLRPQPWTVA